MANSMAKSLLKRNEKYVPSHKPQPYLGELTGPLARTALITCVDPRNQPEKYLNLTPGEDVVIFRNACGHVQPFLNNILALDTLLTLEEVIVIHHTDCGSLAFKNEEVHKIVKARAPNDASSEVADYGAITDLEQSVRDDVAIFKKSALVRKELAENISGYVVDIKTGKLSPVV